MAFSTGGDVSHRDPSAAGAPGLPPLGVSTPVLPSTITTGAGSSAAWIRDDIGMGLFLMLLIFGLLYEWKKGAFQWD